MRHIVMSQFPYNTEWVIDPIPFLRTYQIEVTKNLSINSFIVFPFHIFRLECYLSSFRYIFDTKQMSQFIRWSCHLKRNKVKKKCSKNVKMVNAKIYKVITTID